MPLIMRHVMHSIMLSKHHYLRVVNESEKVVLIKLRRRFIKDGIDLGDPSVTLTFLATQASPGAYNLSLLYTNAFIT